MKNNIHFFLFVFLFAALTGCNKEEIVSPSGAEEGVTLILQSAAPLTKTMQGEDDRNENSIHSLHYFFYPNDPKNPTADPLAQQPKYWGAFHNLQAKDEYTLRINFTEFMLNYEVFPRPYTECQVYVVANLPQEITIDANTDKSLAALRTIALAADFVSSTNQNNFVMEGLGTATITDRKNIIAATGTIPMDRVASKISIGVTTIDKYVPTNEVYGNGKIWYPEPESMTVEFVNGVNRAVLGATPVNATETDYFRTTSRTFTKTTVEQTVDNVTTTKDVWKAEPFYSYPSAWNVGDENEPYLRIMLPWKTIINTGVDGEEPPIDDYQKCYYKLILGGTEMARNTWYDMEVQIGIFGSFDEQEETILDVTETSYFVADWTTGQQINAEITGGRYLVVDKLKYEIYNEDEFRIPFTTSHNCEIVDMSTARNLNRGTITYPDYSDDEANEEASYTWNSNEWSLNIEGTDIVFNHKLRNDISAGKGNYDYAPFTIKFRIRHIGDDVEDIYYKDITIIQYPALIIKADKNKGGNIVNDGNTDNDDKGFVFVNGNQRYTGSDWQVVRSCLDGGNNNPNMYVIQATIPTSDYILADARQLDHMDANDFDNLTNNPSYYYPSIDSDLAEFVIAPKFRIASSYGKCGGTIDKDDAIQRCAAYQENGFPAGRWRVPTFAEMQFIATLSYDEVIPQLFTSGSRYWTSMGAITYNNNIQLNNNNEAYVRCVYDEWYWENSETYRLSEQDKGIFTWGDMSRENFK